MNRRRKSLIALIVAGLVAVAPLTLLENSASAHSCQGQVSGGKPHKAHKRKDQHKCNNETTTTVPTSAPTTAPTTTPTTAPPTTLPPVTTVPDVTPPTLVPPKVISRDVVAPPADPVEAPASFAG